MTRSKSAKMASNGSPWPGAEVGSAARMSPGRDRESTGNRSGAAK
jgi:hypothetical protein